ncbi:ankyrin repeat domain-containing protein [bacterium]|nr:ankyrin repeat domain-containing protein [bacterium]
MKNTIILIFSLILIISCTSKSGENLIKAVKDNDFAKVKKIVTAENVNSTDATGATPAIWAAYNGNIQILDFLIKNGADVRKKGIIGINTDKFPKTYDTTLSAAAGEGHLEIVRYLIEQVGLSPDEKGGCGNNFIPLPQDLKTTEGLVKFIQRSHGKIFDLIKEHEGYENLVNSADEILPYNFCWITGELIAGKNFDFINKIPDEYAVRRIINNRKEFDKVFAKFVKPMESYEFIKEKEMKTPLSSAVFYKRTEVIRELISKGADVNFKDCFGITPLRSAAIAKNFEGMIILLKNGALNYTYKNVLNEDESILDTLLSMRCDAPEMPELKNKLNEILPMLWQSEEEITDSKSGLKTACLCRDKDLVRIFMENGADYGKIVIDGKTLKELCVKYGIETKNEWLKKREWKTNQ